MVKNKEQVRHFYYRTWHKITKYIDFDNGEHGGSGFGCLGLGVGLWSGMAFSQTHRMHSVVGFSPSHMAWGILTSRHLP